MKLDPDYWGKKGDYAVLDLSDGSVTHLLTLAHFHQFLAAKGLSFEDLRFHTFEDQYRKKRIFSALRTVATVLALMTVVTVLVIRRRKRKKSQQSHGETTSVRPLGGPSEASHA